MQCFSDSANIGCPMQSVPKNHSMWIRPSYSPRSSTTSFRQAGIFTNLDVSLDIQALTAIFQLPSPCNDSNITTSFNAKGLCRTCRVLRMDMHRVFRAILTMSKAEVRMAQLQSGRFEMTSDICDWDELVPAQIAIWRLVNIRGHKCKIFNEG